MQLTAQMLLEAFRQTQREILSTPGMPERYQARWERMAALLNEKLENEVAHQPANRPAERGIMDYKLIIFDMNGTLTNTPFIDKQQLHLLPGRVERCKVLRQQGATLAIASNQGGVAFGFVSENVAKYEVATIAEQIGTKWFQVAYGHPSPGKGYEQYAEPSHLAMRKPAPGMLLALMKSTGITASHTLMVGDRSEDEQAAKAAGVSFMWADQFFGKEVMP